jgi:hypothetical protein
VRALPDLVEVETALLELGQDVMQTVCQSGTAHPS